MSGGVDKKLDSKQISMKIKREESVVEYKSGLTWRSWLAVFYSAILFMPIVLFYRLVTGQEGIDPAIFITAILFSEIARIFGSPLTKQEVCVIFNAVGSAVSGGAFLGLLFQGYLATSPLTGMFIDPYTHKPLSELIPWWYAPPRDSEVYILRTFFHSDWLGPVMVLLLFSLFSLLQNIPLSMMMAQLYIEVEKLPFPLAYIDASIIETLAERTPRRTIVFTISSLIGLAWGTVVYGMPTISQGVFRVPMQIIPIPWVDLTHYTERFLPGACIGIATDLMPYIWGMFLPENVVVCMFIGSISLWIFGTWFTLNICPSFFPQWAREYSPGMNISLIYQRSTLWVWASPLIGITLAAGIFPLIKYRKPIVESFKSLRKLSLVAKRAGYLPLHLLLIMYFAGSLGSAFLFHYLIPDFPIFIVILMTAGYSFFMSMVTGRMVGETGVSAQIPYVWQAAILSSGYPKIEPWLLSPPIITATPVYTLKVFQLTNTRPLDFFKTWVITTPLSILMSFVFVSLFWSIAPIPSGFYPATSINWPVSVINTCMWATRQINVFRPNLIVGSMIVMLAIAAAFEFIPLPFHLMGLVAGCTMLPPLSLAWLIGCLIGKYIIQKRIRRETWEDIRPVLAGGIIAGEGVGLGVGAAAVIIARSLRSLPY